MSSNQPTSSRDLPPPEAPLLLSVAQLATATKEMLDVGEQAVWTVSSAKHGSGVNQLFDGNPSTYWQSDGTQPHTVLIDFHKLTCVAAVAVLLDYSNDESYTPRRIIAQTGTNPTDFMDVGDAEVDSPVGWLFIRCFDDLDSKSDVPKTHPFARTLRIIVQENHQNGRDTHIRGMTVFSPKKPPVYSTAAFSMGLEIR